MREWLNILVAFVVTAVLDRFLHASSPGVILADPITIVAVAATVTAATAVTTGVLNYEASQRAADAQRSLKNEQASALAAEATARNDAAAKAAVTGQTFGADERSITATGFGFGKGTANTGLGRGALTGPS